MIYHLTGDWMNMSGCVVPSRMCYLLNICERLRVSVSGLQVLSLTCVVLFCSEVKAMELFRKLREKPRGKTHTRSHLPVRHVIWASPRVSRAAQYRRLSRSDQTGGSGRAVLREEATGLLHTPEVSFCDVSSQTSPHPGVMCIEALFQTLLSISSVITKPQWTQNIKLYNTTEYAFPPLQLSKIK